MVYVYCMELYVFMIYLWVSHIVLLLCIMFVYFYFFFFKQKTAYEMRISDWSSDVCSSDLPRLSLAVRRSARHSPGASAAPSPSPSAGSPAEIGRASCRERVCQYV